MTIADGIGQVSDELGPEAGVLVAQLLAASAAEREAIDASLNRIALGDAATVSRAFLRLLDQVEAAAERLDSHSLWLIAGSYDRTTVLAEHIIEREQA